MRDLETGSWWQQVSGEALHGPLKGKRLNLVGYEEITFDLWKKEQPGGRILVPNSEIAKEDAYAGADWEDRIAKLPTVTPVNEKDPLKPRDLILGIDRNGNSKAYPFASLQKHRAIADSIGDTPIVLLLGPDNRSVRVFEAVLNGAALNFFVKNDPSSPLFMEANTGSEFDFSGKGVSGPLKGKTLTPIPVLKDYWFDWKNYHPQTSVYTR